MRSNLFRRITVFIAIAIINIIMLSNAYTLCTRYPFSRLLNGNMLTNTIKFGNNDTLYKAQISDESLLHLLHDVHLKTPARSSWTVPLIKQDGSTVLHFISRSFNIDLFIYLTILVVTGTVHLLWGVVIFFVKKINKSAKYYAYFSIILGSVLFSYVDIICTGNIILLLLTHAAFYYFALSATGEMLNLSANKRRALSLVLLCAMLAVLLLHLFTSFSLTSDLSFKFYLISFLFLFVFAACFGIYKNHTRRHQFGSSFTVIVASVGGIIIPALTLLITTFFDFPVPAPVITLFTCIIPLTLGRGFIERSHLTEYVIRTVYNIRFIVDFISSLALGLFFYILTSKVTTIHNSILYITSASVILLLRSLILERMRGKYSLTGDKLTLSLQLIAEISVLPKPLEKRLESIFNQMLLMLEIAHLKIGIISHSMTTRLDRYERFFFYIDASSPLAKQYETYRDIIRKDYIFENYEVNYFEGKNSDQFTIIIPVEFESKIPCVIFASDKSKAAPFYSAEFHYLQSAALLIYQMIENELLFQQYLLKGKYEEELDNASYIQMRLFPVELPLSSGIDISFYLRPFNKVTGDYFDIVSLPDNRSAIVIGDITGHGLPAAMLHSTTAALVNALMKEEEEITEVMEYINRFLIEKYRGHELITLLIAVYDPRTRLLRYVNAGHNLPLHYVNASRTVQSLHQRNHILGVMNEPSYMESSITIEPGDKLFLYTDGLVDIRMESGHSLGEKPIITLLSENAAGSGEVIIEKISQLVESSELEDIPDDITAVCISIE